MQEKYLVMCQEDNFLLYEEQLLLDKNLIDQQQLNLTYIHLLPEEKIHIARLHPDNKAPNIFQTIHLRQLFNQLGERWFVLAGKAKEIIIWDSHYQFCAKCAEKLSKNKNELSKTCGICQHVYYPPIAPAVIVLVRRGNEMLLAHSSRFPRAFYSTLAGFVEVGETAEETIVREIREEVGIEVKNIQYFASQAWPFPHQLMLGYFADYASGEIKIDNREIIAADWFSPDNLPQLPDKLSIARRLIDVHLAGVAARPPLR